MRRQNVVNRGFVKGYYSREEYENSFDIVESEPRLISFPLCMDHPNTKDNLDFESFSRRPILQVAANALYRDKKGTEGLKIFTEHYIKMRIGSGSVEKDLTEACNAMLVANNSYVRDLIIEFRGKEINPTISSDSGYPECDFLRPITGTQSDQLLHFKDGANHEKRGLDGAKSEDYTRCTDMDSALKKAMAFTGINEEQIKTNLFNTEYGNESRSIIHKGFLSSIMCRKKNVKDAYK